MLSFADSEGDNPTTTKTDHNKMDTTYYALSIAQRHHIFLKPTGHYGCQLIVLAPAAQPSVVTGAA